MFNFYISTVFMWAIILFALVILCENFIRDNGYFVDGGKKKDKWFIYCLLISAIPVIRLSVAAVLILMAIYPEKEFYEMIEKSRNKRNK